jgi:hypothetical protein
MQMYVCTNMYACYTCHPVRFPVPCNIRRPYHLAISVISCTRTRHQTRHEQNTWITFHIRIQVGMLMTWAVQCLQWRQSPLVQQHYGRTNFILATRLGSSKFRDGLRPVTEKIIWIHLSACRNSTPNQLA